MNYSSEIARRFVAPRWLIALAIFVILSSFVRQAYAQAKRPVIRGYIVSNSFSPGIRKLFTDKTMAGEYICSGGELRGILRWDTSALYCKHANPYYENSGVFVGSFTPQNTCPDYKNGETTSGSFCYAAGEKPPCHCDRHGNPVSLSSKAKIQTETDYSSPHGLNFVRTYTSLFLPNGGPARQWRHNYSKSLDRTKSPDYVPVGEYTASARGWVPRPLWTSTTMETALFHRADGYAIYFFSENGGQMWKPDGEVKERLAITKRGVDNYPTEWELRTEDDSVEVYDHLGRLVSIRFKNGTSQTLFYSDAATPLAIASQPNLLIEVKNNFGASLQFAYDSAGMLYKMLDPAGNEYLYTYDSLGNFTNVTYPTGLRRFYHYDEAAHTTPVASNGLLTGISDELTAGNIVRYSFYKYKDTFPIATEHGNGVDKYTFDYANSTVTDPLGATRGYTYTSVNGRKVQNGKTQRATPASPVQYSTTALDANGNVTTREGFNGEKTCLIYDTVRNLETVRAEGLGRNDYCYYALNDTTLTLPVQKTSTSWHATLRMPLVIASPLLRTTYTYDATGNVTTRTEQPTSDATGVKGFAAVNMGGARQWKYTYNTEGQLLTVTGPRTDVIDKTSYTYDIKGNLETVTTAALHVTKMSNYDAHGRVGRILEPSGVATDLTYTPRGWLATSTVSNQGLRQVTSYDYDGAGQLTTVTRPDGSYASYTYDNARRLTDIADNIGNRIHYTLDNVGNRIKEEVRDPTGVLSLQTTRQYDPLNRLQSVTGGAQ